MGEVIVRASYGIEVQEKDDPYIATAERALWIANQTILPGRWLVDILPICAYYQQLLVSTPLSQRALVKYVPEWVPGAGFKRQARLWRDDVLGMTDKPFNAVKVCQSHLFQAFVVELKRRVVETFLKILL